MTTHHVPKGVSLDTLEEIIAGWSAVGAASEPTSTSAVEEVTGISDAVSRQTRFLEEVGVLEAEGQQHRLTDRGEALASALAADEPERARETARDLLEEWSVTGEILGVLHGNPTDEAAMVPLVAAITGQDPEASRVRSGITTLLDLYERAGLLTRDGEGRYRLPEGEQSLTAGKSGALEGTVANAAEAAEETEADGVEGAAVETALDGAEGASDEGSAGGDASDEGSHAVSLEVDVDADPEDLETLVRSIRRGLTEEDGG